MKNNQIMMKEKLGFFGILKEALKIPYNNPNFIIFTFLTSIPLFFSMLIHEIIFQQTLIETAKILRDAPPCYERYICFGWEPLGIIKRLIEEVSRMFLLLGLLYLGILHFLDLLNTIMIVRSASMIYAEEGKPMTLKELLSIKMASFKGPLVTSLNALLLASLTLLGLVSLATQISMTATNILFAVLFMVLFVTLFTKYMEWSAIWNMGIVISILEEKHGVVAIGVSAYVSRGCRRCGLLLMLAFFVWRLALRLLCFYVGWHEGGSGIMVTAVFVCLVCLGNVMKWVTFMVYFYDCKKRFLEKKVDVEEGQAVEASS